MEGLLRLQNNIRIQILKSHEHFISSHERRAERAYYEVKLEGLEHTWLQFLSNHYELMRMEQLTVECEYLTNEVYAQVEEVYFAYKSDLKRQLSTMVDVVEASEVGDAGFKSIKLPEITIPSFSGLYTEWPTFHDLFDSLIHRNTQLTNIQKLFYLKSHVSGEAEQLLRYTPVTDCNYERSWNLIKKRYCNKRYLANNVLHRLFDQRKLTSESSSSIKQLLDTTSECLSALSDLDLDISTWDILIIHIISQKLDPESRKLWEQKISGNIESLPRLDDFNIFLESRFRALEFLELSERKQNIKHEGKRTQYVYTVTANACHYCEEGHNLEHCQLFRQQEYYHKLDFIRSKGLCFNCLGFSHKASSCTRLKVCQKCHRHHHTLLHREHRSSTSRGSPLNNENDDYYRSVQDADDNSLSRFSKNSVVPHSEVLLPTASVTVDGMKTCMKIRALLDQGAQTSFVTDGAVQLLGLRKMPVNDVVTGVGGDGQNLPIKHKVQFKIQSTVSQFNFDVEAYVLDTLSSSLPAISVKIGDDWPELTSLKLADSHCFTPSRVDVILGAEVYALILKNGIIRDPSSQLTAQNTELGWIVSGRVPEQATWRRIV